MGAACKACLGNGSPASPCEACGAGLGVHAAARSEEAAPPAFSVGPQDAEEAEEAEAEGD